MELRDYLRMLRRGWSTVLAVTVLGVALASLYLVLTPKQYGATTVLFVSTNAPQTVDDLQQGSNFASTAVVTYAQIIDSGTILGPVAAELRPQRNVDELVGSVTSTVREETTLIDIGVTTTDPRSAAVVANAVADASTRILPTFQLTPDGRPLVRIQQIRPAVEPVAASSPNNERILAVGLVIGLFTGLGGSIVRQSLDTRLRRSEDIPPLTNVPLVAVVPAHRGGGEEGLPARDEPASPVGESYRTLRTSLGTMTPREPRSLVFASVADDDDGVQVSANVAWSLAQAGRRVLLVDGDMRSNAIATIFGVTPGVGLAEALSSQDFHGRTHGTTSPQLTVMLSGTTESAPSDLLSTTSLERLLRRLEQEYEIVIVHLPPVLSYADAAIVAAATGGTFVTVSAGRTRAAELTNALETLANVRVRPLGIILTGAERNDRPMRPTGGSARPIENSLDTPTLRQEPVRPMPRPERSNRPMRSRPATNPPWMA